jgi:voltage-gated potassium channel
MFQLLIRFFKKFSKLFKERKILIYAGVYIISLWVIATLVFYFSEEISLFDSFYWAVTTTTTVGYGDITATTFAGKITSMIVMLSGIGVLGLLLATFADILIEKSLRRRHFIESFMEKHIIVCGWDKKLEIAVKELLSEDKEIVVIAEVEDIPIEHKNLMFIKGDPSEDENLKRANVEKASFALISGRNDTETLLSTIAVEKLNKEVHTTCIVSDPKVVQALKKTGVDQILSTSEFFGLFLSRSIFVPKISNFLNELMATKGMDLHQEKISKEFEGRTFLEVINILKGRYNAIPLGIVRENRVIINPEKEMKFKEGDEIVYISEEKVSTRAPIFSSSFTKSSHFV